MVSWRGKPNSGVVGSLLFYIDDDTRLKFAFPFQIFSHGQNTACIESSHWMCYEDEEYVRFGECWGVFT